MQSELTRLKPSMAKRAARRSSGEVVTLVIYGWHESQPGTLAWVFPSLAAALRAVRALRNAVEWLIVEGRRFFDGEVDVDGLRRAGDVLVERALS